MTSSSAKVKRDILTRAVDAKFACHSDEIGKMHTDRQTTVEEFFGSWGLSLSRRVDEDGSRIGHTVRLSEDEFYLDDAGHWEQDTTPLAALQRIAVAARVLIHR